MPTLEEVKEYLGVDWDDAGTDRRLNGLIKTADSYLTGSLGNDYPKDDPRAQELSLIVIGQLYDNSDPIAKVSSAVERLINDFSLQLRMEMRGAANEVQASNSN